MPAILDAAVAPRRFAASLSSLALEPPLSPPAPLAAAGVSSTTGPGVFSTPPTSLNENVASARTTGESDALGAPFIALSSTAAGSALARALFATSPSGALANLRVPRPAAAAAFSGCISGDRGGFAAAAAPMTFGGAGGGGWSSGWSFGRPRMSRMFGGVTSPRSSQFAGFTAGGGLTPPPARSSQSFVVAFAAFASGTRSVGAGTQIATRGGVTSDKEGDSGTRAAPPPSGGDGDAEHAHVLYVK